ncbi:hypothetical protein GWI33_005802 [Rhynchophorus ferrugineus]|uniref:Uncharacterized protein n=1 Tax=Rhynchophorus ferrugineus TaxID=354439 RepID=A0A834IIL0_RHYFE|nr:hypothetical protein GWI33_005802 [Rhynchophorus ferrugineus]
MLNESGQRATVEKIHSSNKNATDRRNGSELSRVRVGGCRNSDKKSVKNPKIEIILGRRCGKKGRDERDRDDEIGKRRRVTSEPTIKVVEGEEER